MKTVLICPLDWGLGHATRCVPLIREFLKTGCKVIIAADNRPLAFLQNEFPDIEHIKLPGYKILYPINGSMFFKMLLSSPRILIGIRKEHKILNNIIKEYNIDIVVSDNRFGLWNKNVKSIYVTHQILIKCPKWIKFFESCLYRLNLFFVSKYDECWIPDFKGVFKLSGDLAHKKPNPSNSFFIGPLSRFLDNTNKNPSTEKMEYDVMFILSGPEPQRTIFENMILSQLHDIAHLRIIIVRGKTDEEYVKPHIYKFEMYSYLNSDQLYEKITKSRIVICRSGYSSIMDLVTLGKRAILVPTPGQTEQEYLAMYYKKKNIFYAIEQSRFKITYALSKGYFCREYKIESNYNTLHERINKLIED